MVASRFRVNLLISDNSTWEIASTGDGCDAMVETDDVAVVSVKEEIV